jgi:ferredoxin-thioredoxin reductase catalytic subunit
MDCRINPTHLNYMRTSNSDLKCQRASVMAVMKWKYGRDVCPCQQNLKML